jgi:hypothetical protein
MKNILKAALVVFLAGSSTALAAGGAETEGLSLLVIVFLAFGAVIVVFQAIPGLILFYSMIRGLFSAPARKAASVTGGEAERKP